MPLDVDALDDDDPFELDAGNRPHLFKHAPFGVEDLLDLYASDPVFCEASKGEAELLMIGHVPGQPMLTVPLAAPKSGLPNKARPIGIFLSSMEEIQTYRDCVDVHVKEGKL